MNTLITLLATASALALSLPTWSEDLYDGPHFQSHIPAHETDFESLAQLQQRLEAQELTATELVSRHVARIQALNTQGPQLRAVIEVNRDAFSIAAQRDDERVGDAIRGPLHGIPVLIKDNINSGDQMQTSAGALAITGDPATKDAKALQRLREAGAVVLGKANLSEWAGLRDFALAPGFSGMGGQTRNPHGEGLFVCGSSSGSAAGIAAGFAPLALGTETLGSIICPASVNGVVGLRPTFGLVSAEGVIPLSARFDTVGPMGRTVQGVATLLNAIQEPGDDGAVDYLSGLEPGALAGKRLGYPAHRQDGSLTLEHPLFQPIAERLNAAGATLVAVEIQPDSQARFPDLISLILADLKAGSAEYLSTRTGIAPQNMADVVAFNEQHPIPEVGQSGLIGAAASELDEDQRNALADTLTTWSRSALGSALDSENLDALIDLAEPFIDLVTLGALSGYPGLTVPAVTDESEMPRGLYITGLAGSDAALLSMGFAFEQSAN
ncbi:amidase family protein [Pseudomonas sp. NPDC088368]|jgi:amidase|uniref:amidase family protein n=1 Tax=Pseudomonas sp. NPDC088368 TaxID=3364453 RepID=UPI0038250CFE